LCLSFVELMWAGMETRLFGVNIKRKKVKRKQSLNKKVRLICWDLVLKNNLYINLVIRKCRIDVKLV
jgi:hypothetical protein